MSDPETHEPTDWMAGFPPQDDRILRFADSSFLGWPQLKWSFNHIEQLVPTKSVWRGPGAARVLEQAPISLEDLEIRLEDGTTMSWDDMLTASHVDAFGVLHRGQLVHESYRGAAGPHRRHTLMSCNKSMVGLIAEVLIDRGVLDAGALVSSIVPELAGSAFADATVRQVLDMTIGMRFTEDYLDPDSDVWTLMRSTGMVPGRPGDLEHIARYLPTVQPEGGHGHTFAYREPNIFVLGWLLRRAADTDIATLASELVWQHIGAEHDWLYMVDPAGAETTATATLRDFLRFGQLVCDGGRVGARQVVPAGAVDAIMAGGDVEAFARGDYPTLPGWSYRSQWWIRHREGRICPTARGAYGQVLYIDPARELVIARFGSAPQAPSAMLDHIVWPTVDAIAEALA